MIERRGAIRLFEPGEKVHQAGERRQPSEPASAAPRDAEVEPSAERAETGRIRLQQRERRFRKHERNIPFESVMKPPALVLDQVVERAEVDQDVVAANLYRKAAQVVGPLVEGAAG